tara:strand:- start:749 stop:1582 length:834 start_codon:yes stop_codon:yes gene_type:complete
MNNKLIYYINGEWIEAINSKIPFTDSGFLYGDGLFETIRFNNNKPFRIKKHIKRLRNGCKVLYLNLGLNDSEIIKIIDTIINKNILNQGLIRLMVTRGSIAGAPWNYDGKASIYALIRPLSVDPKLPVKIVYYNESNYPIIRFNPAIKSMNYVGNLLAKKDAEKDNAYEPVFINKDNYITECAIRNIFYIKDKELITPELNLGILPGVMRDTIIEIAHKMNLSINETKIDISEIDSMDEAFISSTGIGLYPCEWNGWTSKYLVTTKLKNHLNKILNR